MGSRSPIGNPASDNDAMTLFVGAGVALAATGWWGVLLVLQQGASHQVLGLSVLAVGVVGPLGMVLSRGRWSLRLTQLAMGALLLMPLLTTPGWWVVGSVAAALGLAIISTPWGQVGLRKLPPAAPIPDQAIVLTLGLLALPALAAAGQLDSDGWGLVLWAAFVLFVAITYSRAMQLGLWSARLILPLVTIPVILGSPFPANMLTALGTAALVALSWHPQALLAITEATPRRVSPVPVPPELVPEDLLRAAGYDSSGRPIPDPTDE